MNNTNSYNESFITKAFLLMLLVFTFALTFENSASPKNQSGIKTELSDGQHVQKEAVLVSVSRLPLFNVKWTFGCEDEFISKNHTVIKEIYSLQNLSRRHKSLTYIFLSFKKKLDAQSFITFHCRKEETALSYSA